jgi:hypothetical protein
VKIIVKPYAYVLLLLFLCEEEVNSIVKLLEVGISLGTYEEKIGMRCRN